LIYVNGELKPARDAAVSVFDHGLLYGDGVFDTMFAMFGYVFKLDEHLTRFERSLSAIDLQLRLKRDDLNHAVLETVSRNGLTEAYIKIIATRGCGPEPLLDPRGCEPSLIIFARPYLSLADPHKIKVGLNAKVTSVRRVGHEAIDPRIKSLNYLNLILAKIEAIKGGFDEALLPDEDGLVCEGPGYNLFAVSNNVVFTPDKSILKGITRDTILELCHELGIPFQLRGLASYDLYTADEIFLTSTAAGLVPVTRVDARTIGNGAPGPIFHRLGTAYNEMIRSGRHGTRIPQCAESVS
jgi:branched-chain amino acid aminotransferase